MDENGFPQFPTSSSSSFSSLDREIEYSNPLLTKNHHNSPNELKKRSIEFQVADEHEDEGGRGGSFASDFYRCGTDWSCLLSLVVEDDHDWSKTNQDMNNNKKRRLKQTNLLHLWGIPPSSHGTGPTNSNHVGAAASSSSSSSSFSNKANNKKRSISALFVSSNNISSVPTASAAAPHHHHHQQQYPPRVCPFYKKIPGTNFTVDAFRYGHIKACSAYFLTHFHADHYGGLSKRWSHGPIYCTSLTARLLKMCLSVNASFLHPLELATEYVIKGIKVTMLEANHCPGAALILFHLPNGQCVLHTGDFRASKQMQSYPLLINQRVNVLYLDTTYCNPKYRFPSKEAVLKFAVRVTKSWLQKQPKTLVIVGAYSIGKESVYLAIAKALQVKIFVNPARRRILQSFGWPEICGNLCSNGKDTPLHVLPISSLKIEMLERYLKTYMGHYTSVLAFRATGWTYSDTVGNHLDLIRPNSKGSVTIYGVPYSEHSSFTELQEFIQFLRPERIIPTVNVGNAANRDKMQSYFREWLKGR